NNGQRSVLFLAGGLAAGFVVATLMQPDEGGERWAPSGAPLEARIVELERRLASEASARRALSEEVDALRVEVASGAAASASADAVGEQVARAASPELFRRAGSPAEGSADGTQPLPNVEEARA